MSTTEIKNPYKVGTLCYATNQGLGILAKTLYEEGIITHPLIIEHGSRETHREWFPEAKCLSWNYSLDECKSLCNNVDLMLFIETPFHWELISYCRSIGKKTILCVMYECSPTHLPTIPDHFLCPSLLDKYYFPNNSTYLPTPVNKKIEWKLREKAKVFVHNAGYGGLANRNGTGQLLDALQYVESPLRLIIRSQRPLQWGIPKTKANIDVRIGTVPYEQLWEEGEVFVFPDKFQGLSMPLQEARASGMLVMSTNRFPANSWLPKEPLITPIRYEKTRVSSRCLEFDEAVVDPRNIAEKMDYWFMKDISSYSLSGKEWAKSMSWEVLMPKYIEIFEKVIKGV